MKIISFAHTTPALLAGHKTVTRRYWNPRHAASFTPGEIVQAWDKSPRFGGKKVAEIKLLAVYPEHMIDAPDEDYAHEGFVWMCENGFPLFKGKGKKHNIFPNIAYWSAWKHTTDPKYKTCFVVRFEVTKIINH